MSPFRRNATQPIPHEALAEAGVWLARLKGPARDGKLEAGFREWLAASPLHAAAFEATSDVWQDAGGLRRWVPLAPAGRRSILFWRVAIAAGVALLAVGIWLLVPQGIATAVGEQRTVRLEDGTHLTLNTATRVVVHYDRTSRRIELQQGEALFDVAAQPNRPFIVTVSHHQVRALGTSFVVRRDQSLLDVTLIDGKVVIASDGTAGEITLEPGERVAMNASQVVRMDRPELPKALAWRRGQVSLDDTPLLAAVTEMNRYSPVKIRVERAEAGALLVNGLFQAGDSRRFAEAIALTYGLKVIEQDGQLVLTGVPTH